MNLAYFSVLSVQEFKEFDTVAVTFAERTLGDFHYAIPFLIAFLLLGSMNSTIFGSSRYLFAGAKNNVMPKMFKCVHPESMSPRASVLAEISVAIAISFLGNLEHLLNYATYAIWMQRTMVQIALIYMRFKRFPFPSDAFRNPIFIPIIFLAICVALLVIPVKNDFHVGIYAVGFVAVGFVIYFLFIFPKKSPKFLTKLNENLVKLTQMTLDTVPINDETKNPKKESSLSSTKSSKIVPINNLTRINGSNIAKDE
uniref:Uncharacterized protein n=1 Tax=Panagrolaimus sp. JU765 TaxID=591449 RepID=A0AC34QNE7_9BILA